MNHAVPSILATQMGQPLWIFMTRFMRHNLINQDSNFEIYDWQEKTWCFCLSLSFVRT